MTPRSDEASTDAAVVIEPVDEPPYIICRSKSAFVNPTGGRSSAADSTTAKEVNDKLTLNLGLPIAPENKALRTLIRWINALGISWWEDWMFVIIKKLPVSLRRWVCLTGWQLYFQIHKRLLGRRTAIHPAASEEYHALTTVMYWGRLFPVSIPRMRFALSQLSAWTNNHVTSRVDTIDCEMKEQPSGSKITDGHGFSTRVTGLYVHSGRQNNNTSTATAAAGTTKNYVESNNQVGKKVIFWLYGGAYLSGDVDGNLAPAEMVGKACGVDVFLASYSLIPEAKFDEIVWDVCLAYHWLVTVKGVTPSDIILYGISSGSGLATRLMQMIGKFQRGDDVYPSCLSEILSPMPSGAVLLCPFVDYTEPTEDGSFLQYAKHDLIVNQSVLEVGLPYFDIALGDRRRECSPCYDDCRDLPPLCVIVSEHETVYDQTIHLVNEARKQNVNVTLGIWKYQCHVFCFLAAYVPEGRQAMDFANDWIVKEISKN